MPMHLEYVAFIIRKKRRKERENRERRKLVRRYTHCTRLQAFARIKFLGKRSRFKPSCSNLCPPFPKASTGKTLQVTVDRWRGVAPPSGEC